MSETPAPDNSSTNTISAGFSKYTVVYQYILKPPVENEALVRSEMEKARRYRNILTHICRGERDAKRAALEAIPSFKEKIDAAKEAQKRVAIAHDKVKAKHASSRSRKHEDTDATELKEARKSYAIALDEMWSEYRKVTRKEEVRSEFDRIAGVAEGLWKNAREHLSPWWGTYYSVEAEMKQALRRVLKSGKTIALPLWDGADPCDPQFVRKGEYSDFVAVGINDANRHRTHDFMRIDDPVLRENARPEERPRHRLAVRVGTDESGRGPVWARWPMQPDRPLPADAEVTGVKVICSHEARAERWRAHITIRTAEPPKGAPLGTGNMSVDIGWRLVDGPLRVVDNVPMGRIRVACWRSESGERGEIVLSDRMVGAITKADSLRSIRDRWFNETRVEFRKWLNARDVPEWLRKATARMEDWYSQNHLASLVIDWRNDESKHFDGAWDAILALEIWRRQDAHLWHWECAQRNKSLAARKDFYRNQAAQLARRFGVLVLEDFDLRDTARIPDVLEEPGLDRRRIAKIAACGELRSCLEQAFFRRGGLIQWVEPQDTTHVCPTCGAYTEFDAAASIEWTCSGCGVRWDQDDSAALVLLQRVKTHLVKGRHGG